MALRTLILGGTSEARELAHRLASRDGLAVTVSLAGRTRHPVAYDVPVRTGGFGGAEGLARYLLENQIDLLIDATHPFAARISVNAAQAAVITGIRFFCLKRMPWVATKGDQWFGFEDAGSALAALGAERLKVFVALGRQELSALAAQPQHDYLVRSIEPVDPPVEVPNIHYILGRGPFAKADEIRLFSENRIERIVAKNSGGFASMAKLEAARELRIPVHLIDRPRLPEMPTVHSTAEAENLVLHLAASAEKRGV